MISLDSVFSNCEGAIRVSLGLSGKSSLVVAKIDSFWILESKETCSGFISHSFIRGSLINSSNRVIRVSALSLRILSIFSAKILNSFSFCLPCKELKKTLERRKGTFSGSFSQLIALSKQSPKSIWIICPVDLSMRILLRCQSPRPRI